MQLIVVLAIIIALSGITALVVQMQTITIANCVRMPACIIVGLAEVIRIHMAEYANPVHRIGTRIQLQNQTILPFYIQ